MTAELIKTTGITLNGDKITAVNARDLWKFLESKQDFSTWIKRRIEKYDFIEGQDYLLHKFVEQLPSGAKHCIEYLISLDMAKELAMVENNERGRQARQYFIEVEKRFRNTGGLILVYSSSSSSVSSGKLNIRWLSSAGRASTWRSL